MYRGPFDQFPTTCATHHLVGFVGWRDGNPTCRGPSGSTPKWKGRDYAGGILSFGRSQAGALRGEILWGSAPEHAGEGLLDGAALCAPGDRAIVFFGATAGAAVSHRACLKTVDV